MIETTLQAERQHLAELTGVPKILCGLSGQDGDSNGTYHDR